jgi:hypothetical protein
MAITWKIYAGKLGRTAFFNLNKPFFESTSIFLDKKIDWNIDNVD